MSTENLPVDGESTVGAWLEHPTGRIVLDRVFRGRMDTADLHQLRNIPLVRLMTDGGAVPEGFVDSLVEEANGGPLDASSPRSRGWTENIVPGRFDGRLVVVTGAASGMGRAVASRVAREGGRVIAVDLSQQRLNDLAAAFPAERVIPVAADITEDEDIERIVLTAGGPIDALANVAGIADDFAPLHAVSDEMLHRVFDVNVFGVIRLTRAVLPGMMERRRGNIVNVASEASLRGSSSGLAYTAAKTAIVGVTKSTAFMYEKYGIRVNALAPGGTMTGMRPVNTNSFGQDRIKSHSRDVPIAIPEALAASITFLLSDDSVNINGAILPSDGGESVY